MTTIPPIFLRHCVFPNCGAPIDTRREGIYQRTTGWVKRRDQGGGHAVALPRRIDEWACARCVEAESKGTRLQGAMAFGEAPGVPAPIPAPTAAEMASPLAKEHALRIWHNAPPGSEPFESYWKRITSQ